jgi:hypothetical protein
MLELRAGFARRVLLGQVGRAVALATTALGAQSGLPRRADVLRVLGRDS